MLLSWAVLFVENDYYYCFQNKSENFIHNPWNINFSKVEVYNTHFII